MTNSWTCYTDLHIAQQAELAYQHIFFWAKLNDCARFTVASVLYFNINPTLNGIGRTYPSINTSILNKFLSSHITSPDHR